MKGRRLAGIVIISLLEIFLFFLFIWSLIYRGNVHLYFTPWEFHYFAAKMSLYCLSFSRLPSVTELNQPDEAVNCQQTWVGLRLILSTFPDVYYSIYMFTISTSVMSKQNLVKQLSWKHGGNSAWIVKLMCALFVPTHSPQTPPPPRSYDNEPCMLCINGLLVSII